MESNRIKEAIILAAGYGTRLASKNLGVPKPMAPIAGKPFVTYLLDQLQSKGIERVIMAISYGASSIIDYLGDNYNGIDIIYDVTIKPMGTGGNLKSAMLRTYTDKILVLNGDTICGYDLDTMASLNLDWVINIVYVDDTSRYGRIETTDTQVKSFNEKGMSGEGYINSGVLLINKKSFLEMAGSLTEFPLEGILPKVTKLSYTMNDQFFIDIGIPDDYDYLNNNPLLIEHLIHGRKQ